MAQLFVSHSSADNALAAQVKDCLADLGYESVFLDFDPTGGLVPGQAWRDQLFTNLDACDAVVFITTPQSVSSQWCHSELALTRWLRKPILALLVDGSDPHPLSVMVAGHHGIDLRMLVGRSRCIVPDDLHRFDHVLAMDRANLADLQRLRRLSAFGPVQEGKARVRLLRSIERPDVEGRDADVPDPIGRGETFYESTYEILERGCKALLRELVPRS